ncbi:MAG: YebC/PmpR family DNA-binding transcriptional regulator [Patescibacteria group bacterium]
MSGHSKWATTKRKKAAVDAKRAKIFTRLAQLITIAARDGKSGDPNLNASLRVAIDNAKAVSMPKENIDRAVKRGLGADGSAAAIEEIVYEAYGPFGAAILIECLTDNRNRAIAEIKATLNRAGGSIAGAGSVAYQFKRAGEITIDAGKNSLGEENIQLMIIDSGADDFDFDDGLYVVRTGFADLHTVKTALEEAGVVVESAEVIQIAVNPLALSDDRAETVEKLIDNLEALDDVTAVYTNLA